MKSGEKYQSIIVAAIAGFACGKLIQYLLSQKQSDTSLQDPKQKWSKEKYKRIFQDQYGEQEQCFFPPEQQKKIEQSKIMVFGVGGVGSHVVNCLIRSGVQYVKIVDFDRVTLSSLNRHAFATREDVGISKVQCIQRHVKLINPKSVIETVQKYVKPDNVDDFFADFIPDYVIDCIDNIPAIATKIKSNSQYQEVLVSRLIKPNFILFKLFSFHGKHEKNKGLKSDPTRLQIIDISESKCKSKSKITSLPQIFLNKMMILHAQLYETDNIRLTYLIDFKPNLYFKRRVLKKVGIQTGVQIIVSVQSTDQNLVPLDEEQSKDPNAFQVFDNYRLRTVPVLGTMPALMGYALCSYVLCDIGDKMYVSRKHDYISYLNYARLYCILNEQAKKLQIRYHQIEFDIETVYILAREIYKWTCIVTNKHTLTGELVIWDIDKPMNVYNIVYMEATSAKKHKKITQFEDAVKNYSPELVAKINEKIKETHEFVAKDIILYQ